MIGNNCLFLAIALCLCVLLQSAGESEAKGLKLRGLFKSGGKSHSSTQKKSKSSGAKVKGGGILRKLAKLAKKSGGHHKKGKHSGGGTGQGQSSSGSGSNELEGVQIVEAKGTLLCEGKPADGVLLKLYDEDHMMDDLLDSSSSDANGQFHVIGGTEEHSAIEPKLNVYHDCADHLKPCQRKFSIRIPADYIQMDGQNDAKVFDVGTIELAPERSDEGRDCFHA